MNVNHEKIMSINKIGNEEVMKSNEEGQQWKGSEMMTMHM